MKCREIFEVKFRCNWGDTVKNVTYLFTRTQPDADVNLNLAFCYSQAGQTGIFFSRVCVGVYRKYLDNGSV